MCNGDCNQGRACDCVEPYEGDDFAFFYGLFWALKWTAISGAILAGVLSWVLP